MKFFLALTTFCCIYKVSSGFDDKGPLSPNITFYQSHGVLLEPAGYYYSYAGVSIIPLVYTLPSFNVKEDIGNCSTSDHLDKLYEGVITHIRDMLQSRRSGTYHIRQKRFLGAIAMGGAIIAQIGIDIYNTYESISLESRVQALMSNEGLIKENIKKIENSVNLIVDKVNVVSVAVSETAAAIKRMSQRMDCQDVLLGPSVTLAEALITELPSEYMAAFNAAIVGRITPELISVKNLEQVIVTHPDIKNTIYQQNPTLVYELGKFITLSLNVDEKPSIHGVMYLPKITQRTPHPVYNTYAVNILHNNHAWRIKVPAQIACSRVGHCWDFDASKCIVSSSKTVCLQGVYQNINNCIKGLHKADDDACEFEIASKDTDTLIYQLGAGILIGATNTTIKAVKIEHDVITPVDEFPPSNSPKLITSKDSDYILIKNEVYSTKITGVEFKVNITLSEFSPKHTEYILPDTSAWQPLTPLNLSWDSWIDIPSSYTSLIFIIILILITIFLVYMVIRRLKNRNKKNSKEHPDFLLLNPPSDYPKIR
ncbi:putative glycoprotein [Anisopteromalus calandrae negative-strand RNA virus 1]|uniref:Fusion glycoprotein F0 n=1 Tax=Anisopteromalus calandrae negative-strand RNA virus 1 TaxID=2848909 RepID=A0AAE7RZ94_9MONO|nr:putative glycoprotein [Anisopteromalus calandrae negative-strand RNA virus 1]QWT43284.1 putative glycoprotein [Anisopteromalus calandrae negative-strand RNA virus 1]